MFKPYFGNIFIQSATCSHIIELREVATLSQIFSQTGIFRKVFFLLYSISLTSPGEAENLTWGGGGEGQKAPQVGG